MQWWKVRKIAAELDVSFDELVLAGLERIVAENAERRLKQLEALHKSFEQVQVRVGEKTWTRADLHERKG